MIKDLALSSAIYAAGSFASKFAKLLLIPVMVRYLTPEEVGIIVFLEAVMLACSRFFSLGLGQAVRRFYGDIAEPAAANAYVRMLWLASLGFAFAGLALFGTLAILVPQAFSSNVPAALILLTLLAGALRSTHSIPMQRFVARGEPGRHSLLEFLELVTTISLILLLLAGFGWGVSGYLWGSIIASAVWTIVYGLLLSSGAGPQRTFRGFQRRCATPCRSGRTCCSPGPSPSSTGWCSNDWCRSRKSACTGSATSWLR